MPRSGLLSRARQLGDTSLAFARNFVGRKRHKQRYMLQDLSAYDTILRDGLMSVRHYHALTEDQVTIEGQVQPVQRQRYRIPLVMVPPLGVFAWIFDLMADRSLVRYFLAHGYDVYLIDWGAPNRDDKYLTLETYVGHWLPLAMKAIREHSGRDQLSMMGYCMGGLLCLLYLAASKDRGVVNLVTIASPVDMHKTASGRLSALIEAPAHLIRKTTGFRLDRLDDRLFHVPGPVLSFLFRMSNPMATVSSYVELLRNLGDDDYVARYMTMNEWFTNMPDYPGGTVQALMRDMGLYNQMVRGRIKVGGVLANFADITANLLAFSGDNDAIVSVPAAEAVMAVVSSQDKTFQVVPGGHAGVFTGGKAAHTTWAISAAWLSTRSGGWDAATAVESR